jgi:hypothetical protein
MAFEELDSPIAEIEPEDQPDIMAYSLLRNFIADLNPRKTTPGMDMWSEFRYRTTGETNYARWSDTFAIDGVIHTVALFGVQGEKPGGKKYSHSALRCSCNLPDYRSFRDLDEEYEPCPAKDMVINERVGIYRNLVGVEKLGTLSDESLRRATVFLVNLVRKNPLAWPPSNRSDRLLIDPVAEVFGVSKEKMREGAEELAQENVVRLYGESYPSISLAA